MKILHTSDWHIGQNFYRYDREEEFIHFFNQLGRIISDEKPDIMLVSGDIFDTAAPSISSVRLYNRAMIDFSRNNPHMAIVVTAGNHVIQYSTFNLPVTLLFIVPPNNK